MKIDIKKIWSEQESSSGKQVIRERISSVPDLNCYIGIIGYTGVKMFQLEIENTVDIHKNYLHRFRGVEIQVIPKENGNSHRFTIILIEQELTDIFILFIEDIINKLITISDPEEALNLINQRVNYWRKLFARVTGEILSPEKQRGLFGELFILQLFLNNGNDKNVILNSWIGSQSANQDFALEKMAVEVKTSKAGNPSVFISNEHQLDYTAWNHIYLCTIAVHETAGKQNTLYHLICEIKNLLNHDSKLIDEFQYKLSLAGINSDTIENYNETSYTVRNYRFFEVKAGFPVITCGTLENDAIYNVKYQIDISACKAFEVQEEEVLITML